MTATATTAVSSAANEPDQPDDYPEFIGAESIRLDQAINRIAQAILDYRAEFLFGAGMSLRSKIPSGADLARGLLKKFFEQTRPGPTAEELNTIAAKYPLEAIADAVEAMPGIGTKDLLAKIADVLFKTPTKPNEAHDVFLSLCFWDAQPRFKRIFTTNFDDLLEAALNKKGVQITVDNYPTVRDVERDGKQIPIIHLHGTLERACQVTETDLFGSRFDPIKSLLRSALTECDAFVFVGYSATDPDLRRLYMQYREEIRIRDSEPSNPDKTTYVVGPCATKFEYMLGSEVWKRRGAVWIPLSAWGFFVKVRAAIERTAGEAILDTLKEKFDYADDVDFHAKVIGIREILCATTGDSLLFLKEARRR